MKIKKIIKWIFLIAIILFVIFFLNFVFESRFYGFKTLNILYTNKHPPFLKNELEKQIELTASDGNRSGDTICYYHYAKKYGLITFKMSHYDLVNPSRITLTKSNGEYASFKDDILIENIYKPASSFIAFSIRAKLKYVADLRVEMEPYATIDTLIRADSYVFYSLNFVQLALWGDNHLDIIINKMSSSLESNFMMYKYKGEFYLIFYYSLDGSSVKKDELLNIIDLN